jgi:RHS repeat-associated protein
VGPYVYGYDTAGRAISESRPDVGGTVSWTLDGNGNRATLTWPETGALAYSTSYAYDALNRLTDVFEGPAASGVLLGQYSYDALSERTGIAYGGTTAAGGGRPPIATTAASFTTASQVAQLTHSFNGASLTLGYSYNQDHQRTGVSANDDTFLVSGLTAASNTYTANNLNEYATVDGLSYSYDPKGNLTGDGTFTYAYDAESHLLSATSTGTTATYAYDPQSRRKAKTLNGTTTNYLSVGNQEIAEYDGSGNLLRRYVYGVNLDEPLVTVDAAGNHSYHFTDAQGSVVALANASGQLAEKHAYSAYGLAASTAGTAFQFTGRRVDPETGLYYYRARYYSPALGRFLQADPIGTKGGINLYAYVGNDPVNATDPMGKDCSTSNGFVSCASSNYQFTVPVATSPLAWPFNGTDAVNFTSSDPGYHTYSTPANNGNAINVSPEAAYNYIVNNPVPGTSNPATPAGTANDATPFIGNNYAVISPVMSYTTINELNGQPIMVNITLPGHLLDPGIVVREVDTDANGGTIINNWGEGTAALQDPNSWTGFASKSINGVWNDLYPHK